MTWFAVSPPVRLLLALVVFLLLGGHGVAALADSEGAVGHGPRLRIARRPTTPVSMASWRRRAVPAPWRLAQPISFEVNNSISEDGPLQTPGMLSWALDQCNAAGPACTVRISPDLPLVSVNGTLPLITADRFTLDGQGAEISNIRELEYDSFALGLAGRGALVHNVSITGFLGAAVLIGSPDARVEAVAVTGPSEWVAAEVSRQIPGALTAGVTVQGPDATNAQLLHVTVTKTTVGFALGNNASVRASKGFGNYQVDLAVARAPDDDVAPALVGACGSRHGGNTFEAISVAGPAIVANNVFASSGPGGVGVTVREAGGGVVIGRPDCGNLFQVGPDGTGVIVEASSNHTVVAGNTVAGSHRGAGLGIGVLSAGTNTTVHFNRISGLAVGIQSGRGTLLAQNNTIVVAGVAGVGARFQANASVVLANSTVRCEAAACADGVEVTAADVAVLGGVAIEGPFEIGVECQQPAANTLLLGLTITNSTLGVAVADPAGFTVSNSTISAALQAVSISRGRDTTVAGCSLRSEALLCVQAQGTTDLLVSGCTVAGGASVFDSLRVVLADSAFSNTGMPTTHLWQSCERCGLRGVRYYGQHRLALAGVTHFAISDSQIGTAAEPTDSAITSGVFGPRSANVSISRSRFHCSGVCLLLAHTDGIVIEHSSVLAVAPQPGTEPCAALQVTVASSLHINGSDFAVFGGGLSIAVFLDGVVGTTITGSRASLTSTASAAVVGHSSEGAAVGTALSISRTSGGTHLSGIRLVGRGAGLGLAGSFDSLSDAQLVGFTVGMALRGSTTQSVAGITISNCSTGVVFEGNATTLRNTTVESCCIGLAGQAGVNLFLEDVAVNDSAVVGIIDSGPSSRYTRVSAINTRGRPDTGCLAGMRILNERRRDIVRLNGHATPTPAIACVAPTHLTLFDVAPAQELRIVIDHADPGTGRIAAEQLWFNFTVPAQPEPSELPAAIEVPIGAGVEPLARLKRAGLQLQLRLLATSAAGGTSQYSPAIRPMRSRAADACDVGLDGPTGLTVDCSGRGLTQVPSGIPDNTTRLLLMDNSLCCVNSDVVNLVRLLPDLRDLNLSNAGMFGLPDDLFVNGPDLRLLDLSHNPVSAVSERTFVGLANVFELGLAGLGALQLAAGALEPLQGLRRLNGYNTLLRSAQPNPFQGLLALQYLSAANGTALGRDQLVGLTSLVEVQVSGGCPPGFATILSRPDTCARCPPGTFAPDGATSISSCEPCPAGTVDANSYAGTSCKACAVGKYTAAGQFGSCGVCPRGTTDDDYNPATPCRPCGHDHGAFARAGTAGRCPRCPSGYTNHDNDASSPCEECYFLTAPNARQLGPCRTETGLLSLLVVASVITAFGCAFYLVTTSYRNERRQRQKKEEQQAMQLREAGESLDSTKVVLRGSDPSKGTGLHDVCEALIGKATAAACAPANTAHPGEDDREGGESEGGGADDADGADGDAESETADLLSQALLGQGTFGVVLACTYQGSERAIKVFAKQRAVEADGNYFPSTTARAEGRRHVLLSDCEHLVWTVGYGVIPPPRGGGSGFVYILFDRYAADIHKAIASWDYTAASVARWLTGVASGLEYMRVRGWSHGDIKADNVLLTHAGPDIKLARAVLTDFGLASRDTDATSTYPLDPVQLTNLGSDAFRLRLLALRVLHRTQPLRHKREVSQLLSSSGTGNSSVAWPRPLLVASAESLAQGPYFAFQAQLEALHGELPEVPPAPRQQEATEGEGRTPPSPSTHERSKTSFELEDQDDEGEDVAGAEVRIDVVHETGDFAEEGNLMLPGLADLQTSTTL